MNKNAKRLVIIYAVAALTVLSALSAVLYERCVEYRRAALYSSGAAFEAAVKATGDMSEALKKSLYATDGSMCTKLCSEIYADALAAESAISVLPFDTVELEQTAAFINTAGDYAYMLCRSAAAEGFSEEQAKTLHDMAKTAAMLAERLRQMQSGINNGDAVLDERQELLSNVEGSAAKKLSELLLECEGELPEAEPLSYDGRYTARAPEERGTLDEAQMLTLAAKALGVEERELKKEYEYEGEARRRCFSAGDRSVIVSTRGIEALGCSRLVYDEGVSEEQARAAAEQYLAELGFEQLALYKTSRRGGLLDMVFVSREGDALCTDNAVSVTVALDNGEIFALNAAEYSAEKKEQEWKLSAEQARKKLPEGVEEISCEKLVIRSEGRLDIPCYKFACVGEDGELGIYVDAQTGLQCRIEI